MSRMFPSLTAVFFSALLSSPLTQANPSYRVENVAVPEGVVMEVSGMDYSADGVLYL